MHEGGRRAAFKQDAMRSKCPTAAWAHLEQRRSEVHRDYDESLQRAAPE